MGCDIHLHTEVKIGGAWHHYSAPSVPRSYALFGKMAGVRGSETPIALPKGLPDLPSYITALDAARWGQDGHSHSWLDAAEITQLCAWADDRADEYNKVEGNPYWYPERDWGYGYLFGSGWDAFYKYKAVPNAHSIPPEIQDIRWVFWFDN